jgi:LysM repeat protein
VGEINSFDTPQAFHVFDKNVATPTLFLQNLQVNLETYGHSALKGRRSMSDRRFRMTPANSSSPTAALRLRSRHRAVVAIPVAVTALLSVIFGAQNPSGAHAAENTRAEKVPQEKTFDATAGVAFRPVGGSIDRGGLYTVVDGDTVSQIAATAGVSTAELLAANGLSWKTLIFPDQQLNIPQSTSGTSVSNMAPAITRHRVNAGDTLEMIGRTYGVQPRALLTANGLDRTSRLIVGQRLVIPDAAVMSGLPAAADL